MDRTQLRDVLKELLEDETGDSYGQVEESSDLTQELGLDSVDFVSLVLQIENKFTIKLETRELQNVRQVGDMIDLIVAKLPPGRQAAA